MATRKRRAKEVEKEEVKVTKRGRRVKKVNYDDIFSESSSSEEMIDTRKRKQEDSDQEFNVDVGPQESSSEESVYSENSEPVNDLANEGSVGLKKKPQAKGKTKASIKNPKEEIKMKANDSTTNVSCGGLSRSSNPMIPTIIKNPRTPKKTPFGLDEDVEEIDGQKVPDFIRKEFIRDKNLKKPDDIEYDPSTVDIPKEMYDKLTPMQKQYWDIKRDHFDSVVLWRKGDWYIVLYHDIHALNSTSDSLPRTFHNEPGFYQNKCDHYISELIKNGYKVIRVEQTETHEQMKQRVAERKKEIQKKGIKKDKIKKSDPVLETCVGREIAAKYTKGTYQKPVPIADFLEGKEDNDEELDTKYVLLYLYDEEKNTFGVTYFDITTLQFSIGQFQDDSMKNKFRTLITRIRPVEVLCEAKFMKSDMSKMLRSSPIPPTFSNITAQEKIDYLASKDIIEFYLKSESGKMPKLIQKAMENSDDYSLALSALGNSIKYLQFLMIADKTVPLAEFYEYSHERSTTLGDRQKNSAMILDAQALENLEILEVQGKLSRIHEGSLLHHVDRCSTKFGKRLLKKWICSPLFDDKKLIGRHDAVEYLVKHDTLLNKFKKKMRKYADLERYLCRIYKYSISTNSNAIYVNENSLSRLDELYILLSQLEDITKDISDIFGDHKDISAHRLKALVTFQPREYSKGFGTKKIKKKIKNKYKKEETKGIPREESKQEIKDEDMNADSEEDEKVAQKYKDELNNRLESDGILPDIRPELETFRKVITWKTIGKKKFPEPTKGLSEDFDNANEKVEQLKASISNCLEKARKELKNKTMKFNTASKANRFEFELPISRKENLPSEYFVTSKSKKFVRFQNDELKDLVDDLVEAEDALQDAISPFLAKLFRKFYKKQYLWSDFVSCIAELDCLISLAIVSKFEDDMVKPVVIPRSCDASDRPILELQGVKHPCVSKMLKGDFIPNNVSLGGDSPLVNIITGPNMGGKSTLLRQTCIAIIMCQIGCFVPASSCRMTLFDRIFTRIGASDRILENKSTFFVEMEETKTIVEQSTPYSLVIMDELGRGTSTFDGYSIAHAVLSYQVKQNQCLTLFTTHYHMLVDSFKDEAEVENYKMSCEVDSETHDVTFLYKFEKGYAKESQGIYVAKMAKIPLSICERAKVKCDEFNDGLKELEVKCKIRSKSKTDI